MRARNRKEKARKRELLAQDLAFLADSELNDLALILIRQKNRAEGRKDYDKEKAGSLLKKYEEVQDESVARRPLQSLYVTLEKAKKTRIHGNEAEFDGLMRLFIGELMWRGEFGRIEAVSHASGMNGPAVAAIAAEQVKAALGAGKPETASQINSKYGCYAPAEFEALNAGTP